jgi:predicted metal-dependent enzyme (double-stranded beta helix superfamily)
MFGVTRLSSLEEELTASYARGGTPEEQFVRLRGPLENFLRNPALDLAAYDARTPNQYARYLLSAPAAPLEIVLALWRPGADSPIHGHGGLTGAVGLVAGELVETKYELAAAGAHFRAVWQGGGKMQPGLASSIFPGGMHQVHRMYNPGVRLAASLHVYLGKLRRVQRYLPAAEGLLRAETRELWFDG